MYKSSNKVERENYFFVTFYIIYYINFSKFSFFFISARLNEHDSTEEAKCGPARLDPCEPAFPIQGVELLVELTRQTGQWAGRSGENVSTLASTASTRLGRHANFKMAANQPRETKTALKVQAACRSMIHTLI